VYVNVCVCVWHFLHVQEQDIVGEIDLEEHRRRLHHVSRVKEATVCFVFNFVLNCQLIDIKSK